MILSLAFPLQVRLFPANKTWSRRNMLPLRFPIFDGMTYAELVKATQSVILDGAEHQQLSYGALLKQLAIKRDPSRLPLINVVFNLDQAAQGNELGFAGVDVRFLTNPRHFENFELFINASETLGETVLEVQYNTDLFDQETVTRWFSGMQMLLESAANAPNTRIDSLNLLAPDERDKLLKDWNATEREYGLNATVHELFEAQVDRTPDAVALQFRDAKLTYSELDARSNQLARYLRGLGVTPDRLVAIYAERSVEMVVGMIAVHKAGVPMCRWIRTTRKSGCASSERCRRSHHVDTSFLATKLPHEDRRYGHRVGYGLARHRKSVTEAFGTNING